MQRILVPLGILLALAAGCGSNDASVGTIEFAVTGGFTGAGDGTALHVEPDGTAMRSVLGGPWQTATLDPTTLRDLQAKIRSADFPSLDAMYPGDAADDFVDEVTVKIDGTDHTVAADRSADLPDELATVVDALKAIHDSSIDWQ
jgi:hypothetical protein